MSIQSKIVLSLCVALFATSAVAQNHPMPGAVPDPPVICTGCPGVNGAGEPNDGKPTFPYDVPLSLHAGRFVDSSNTITALSGMPTVRADFVRSAPNRNRLYIVMTQTLTAYALDTFFTEKLKQPMVALNTISTGNLYGGRNPYEKLAAPDRFFLPTAKSSGWQTILTDSTPTLTDADPDDRGFVYVATNPYGWGIVTDPGDGGGSHLPSVQITTQEALGSLFSLRSGESYFVMVANASSPQPRARLYDVTNAASPVLVTTRTANGQVFHRWSKHESTGRVALGHFDGHIRVYTYAALIAGLAPLVDVPPPGGGRILADFSFDDEGNLWIAEGNVGAVSSNVLRKLTPAEDGYTDTSYDIYGGAFSALKIHAAGGYVAVAGRDTEGQFDLRLLRMIGGTPQLLDTNAFFRNYYHHAPSGYAQPSGFAHLVRSVRIIPHGGKTYLFYNAYGLGDVFELGDGPRVTSIAPQHGIPAGGTNVSLYGRGFAPGSSVTFDGILASSTFVSDTQLNALSPEHASGSVDVVVSVPAGATMTAPRKFTYELLAPQQFVATALDTNSVSMSWSAVNGATHYEVLRRSAGGSWDVVGTPSGTSFTDGGRTAETSYVYRVRAADAASNVSAESAQDAATTMSASAAIMPGMLIRAADVILLRSRINSLRTALSGSEYPFTNAVSGTVKAQDVNELRDALIWPRAALGFKSTPFTDSVVAGQLIRAVHLNELVDYLR